MPWEPVWLYFSHSCVCTCWPGWLSGLSYIVSSICPGFGDHLVLCIMHPYCPGRNLPVPLHWQPLCSHALEPQQISPWHLLPVCISPELVSSDHSAHADASESRVRPTPSLWILGSHVRQAPAFFWLCPGHVPPPSLRVTSDFPFWWKLGLRSECGLLIAVLTGAVLGGGTERSRVRCPHLFLCDLWSPFLFMELFTY